MSGQALPIHLWKHDGVEHAILQYAFVETREIPTVQFAVSDEYQFAGLPLSITADRDLRLLPAERLEAGEHIRGWADLLFHFPIHQFDRPRVESCPGELREVPALHFGIVLEFRAAEIELQ